MVRTGNLKDVQAIQNLIRFYSEVGKMLLFPAHILHRAPPHMKKDEERIVMSANWRLTESYPGGSLAAANKWEHQHAVKEARSALVQGLSTKNLTRRFHNE